MGSEPAGPKFKGKYSRGYLPHHDLPRQITGITFRLADSVPARLLRRYAALCDSANQHGVEAQAHKRTLTHMERYLAKGKGSVVLRDPRVATIVERCLHHGEPLDYRLIAWVVMPNHVHVLIERTMRSSLPDIVRRWKGESARRINQLLGRTGTLWFRDYYDRDIEIEPEGDHLSRSIRYIELNPVKAGLCTQPGDWAFSSARLSRRW